MTPNDIARYACIHFLQTRAVQAIDFVYGPYPINGAGFSRVGAAIVMGSIIVSVVPDLPADTGAQYVAATNELQFRVADISTGGQEMTTLHECTHALIANSGARLGVTWGDSEAAAFVAGALSMMPFSKGLSMTLSNDNSYDFDTKVEPYATAWKVASSLRGKPGAAVSAKDQITLRSVIMNCQPYKRYQMTLGTPNQFRPTSWD